MHNDFTLFSKVVPSGKKVVYYYAYDENNNRLGPWSTGQDNKTMARNYCNKLNREGKLLPSVKEIPTFAQWADGFWDWNNSSYLKERKKRRRLTEGYADRNVRVVKNNLIPYFGKMRLDQITGEVIDGWLDYMIKEGYKNTSCNSYYSTIQTMLKYAAKKGVIARDPFLDVEKLLNDADERTIITREEFKALFVDDWKKVWNGDLLTCTANKLAALTGLRCSEILGLKGEFVFDNHIYVCAQYDNYGYRETKTKTKNNIPLSKDVIKDLKKLMEINGMGFIFSLSGGDKPVTEMTIYNGLKRALVNIGISDEERQRRNIDVHAWRHFCNTELLKAGLSVTQVQAVTRHKSTRMTEHYSHFDPTEFTKATEVQNDLLKSKKDRNVNRPKKKAVKTSKKETVQKNEKPVLKLVKLTEVEKSGKRKKAS